MQKLLFPVLILYSLSIAGQSKSIDKFRKEYKEDNNVFVYSSTLKMLDTDENPEFADLVKDIEEIRVLNYTIANQRFTADEIKDLKNDLKDEQYKELLILTEQGNKVFLYGKEEKEKTVGFVALVENTETFMIIDVTGGLDFNKFMQLKSKLDTKL